MCTFLWQDQLGQAAAYAKETGMSHLLDFREACRCDLELVTGGFQVDMSGLGGLLDLD